MTINTQQDYRTHYTYPLLFVNLIFTLTGPKLWNSLEESMKQPQSLTTFKHKFKTMSLNNYAN